MAKDEERLEENDAGYYVRSGDVLEWKWKKPEAETEAEPPKKRGRPKKQAVETGEEG